MVVKMIALTSTNAKQLHVLDIRSAKIPRARTDVNVMPDINPLDQGEYLIIKINFRSDFKDYRRYKE